MQLKELEWRVKMIAAERDSGPCRAMKLVQRHVVGEVGDRYGPLARTRFFSPMVKTLRPAGWI